MVSREGGLQRGFAYILKKDWTRNMSWGEGRVQRGFASILNQNGIRNMKWGLYRGRRLQRGFLKELHYFPLQAIQTICVCMAWCLHCTKSYKEKQYVFWCLRSPIDNTVQKHLFFWLFIVSGKLLGGGGGGAAKSFPEARNNIVFCLVLRISNQKN